MFTSCLLLVDNFAPFKKISKYKLKFKWKPWIAPGLQKSISVKNKFPSDFIKKEDPTIKAELHLKYKNHRNIISTPLKRSKQNYYKKYFESNLNNSKNTWKGMKSIITMKNVISTELYLEHSLMVKIQPLTLVKLLMSSTTILRQLLKLQSRTLIIPINTFLNT